MEMRLAALRSTGGRENHSVPEEQPTAIPNAMLPPDAPYATHEFGGGRDIVLRSCLKRKFVY